MIYSESLALLTDLYELTMAQAYWRSGTHTKEAVFHLFFRKSPFGSGFSVACGLGTAVELLESFRFCDDDVRYLSSLTGNDGKPLFDGAFLQHLRRLELGCDIDAVPEGTVVFPQEPLVRVRGPIVEAQILETALLNVVNFQTLIATKAARVCLAARGDPVIEFGLRRAQGIDGGLAASRAAYVGGCAGTSNVLAGKVHGIPVRGTHAHSWVMSFDSEMEAFRSYAEAMPNNCVFLVDTYDTLQGVRNAIEVGRWLRSRGQDLAGIRLDSGDLAYLSIETRKMLDAAGFKAAAIVASNDLDEHVIESLKHQAAAVGVWGVGTRLATAYDQPAMGGVYKLSAVRRPGEPWRHKVKLSEQAVKVSTPGVQQVRRFERGGELLGDAIYDEERGIREPVVIVDPLDATRRKKMPPEARAADLLEPVFRRGRRVAAVPPLAEARERTRRQLAMLHDGVKRLMNPHEYPVGLEEGLHELRTSLVLAARGAAGR
ncbi:MAG: nicotinate phosphoribosyltransferase [Planctomycetes bacterium]|nr:nicotinate phosphoribosyltransferase [Planctomycetota bacterium]